jgi:RNA-directed DNA polymerase
MSNKTVFAPKRVSNHDITWNDVNWKEIENRVRRIQLRIYRAKRNGDKKKVHKLQKFLMTCFEAKLMAVRQVTTLNRGRKTPGVDKQVASTPNDKMRLVRSLELNGGAYVIRRVWIPKPGKTEKRPLGIPVILDRAKQTLVKLALEPEWEAVFEPNSYGFRPGRRTHDAIEGIFCCLNRNTPKWIFDADIRKCFDTINHNALLDKLDTFPAMRNQIQAWLKAGVMEGYAQSPKDYEDVIETAMGTPQGGGISPLLANIALHGLENHLTEFVANLPIKPSEKSNRGRAAKISALGFIRYADDFVIIHRNREILDLCIEQTKQWLSTIGLTINDEKSKIRDSRQGFKFLGFKITNVRKMRIGVYKTSIVPSKDNCEKFQNNIRSILQKNKSISSYQLINLLKPRILGWANYYRYCECKDTFRRMDFAIFNKLRAWVFRRDTKNGRTIVRDRYFPKGKTYVFNGRVYKDNWVLVGRSKDKKDKLIEKYLLKMSWVKSEKFVKIKGDASPFNGNKLYWSLRTSKHSYYATSTTKLLKRQNGICPICNIPFTVFDDESWEIDHIKPRSLGGKHSYDNLQLLHKSCHIEKSRTDGSRKVNYEISDQALQEPDEGKLSRPDLKTRRNSNISS